MSNGNIRTLKKARVNKQEKQVVEKKVVEKKTVKRVKKTVRKPATKK